jgi:hypothetical protein
VSSPVGVFETLTGLVPSAFMTKISSSVATSRSNAIFVPSGEKLGN